MFYLYILRNHHNRLYIGQTDDLQRRLKDHGNSHGAKFVKDYGNFQLVYTEEFETRTKAMHREKQLKGWTRAKKRNFDCWGFGASEETIEEHAAAEKDAVRYPTPTSKLAKYHYMWYF